MFLKDLNDLLLLREWGKGNLYSPQFVLREMFYGHPGKKIIKVAVFCQPFKLKAKEVGG